LANRVHLLIKKFSTQLYLGWVLFIALITLLPGSSIPGNIDWNFLELDKIIHMIVFAILTYLGGYFFTARGKTISRAILSSILPAIIYGALIEFLQMFIPQRGFDFADLTADIVGAILGVLLFKLALHKKGEV
jgi:uncharacterized protein YfiM (DUF2279 family)